MWETEPSAGRGALRTEQQDDGGLVWVPQTDRMLHPDQLAGAAGLPPAGTEGLSLLPSLQAAATPAPVLDGSPQLYGALLPPLPSLPIASGDASAGGAGQPADSSFAATTETVDKQAIAREKNRLAQRRFRCAACQD